MFVTYRAFHQAFPNPPHMHHSHDTTFALMHLARGRKGIKANNLNENASESNGNDCEKLNAS